MSSEKHLSARATISYPLILLFLIVFLFGCSGGESEAILPGPGGGAGEALAMQDGMPQRYLSGCLSGYADPENGIFQLTPLRTANAHINAVTLLNFTGGVSAQVLWGESIPLKGLLTVRITIKNPYFGALKYTGFDTRGILITGASEQISPDLWTAGKYEPRLLNADGYTRWWNPTEFTNPGYFGYLNGKMGDPDFGDYDAKLNAYKLFADSLPEDEEQLHCVATPDLNADNGRAVFRSAQCSRIYNMQFPKGKSYFNYAIDVSWAEPGPWPPEVPDDFPPYANCNEAWYVRCHLNENNLEYMPGKGCTGFLSLYIYVYDWQGRMLGAVDTQVASINIYSTGLLGSDVGHAELTFDNGTQGVYYADLSDICKAGSAGTYQLGVEVVSKQGTYKQSWQSAPNAPLAAYQLIPVEVTGIIPVLEKTIGIHAYILRMSNGTWPAATSAVIAEDIKWANDFWNQYGIGFELVEKTYLNSSKYYNLEEADHYKLFNWQHDSTGMINLYYVKRIVGMGAAAFAIIYKDFENQKGSQTYVVMGTKDCENREEILAHELGHNIAMLEDTYLLDEFVTCSAIAAYRNWPYPNDVFCLESDAVMGNLMYWCVGYNAAPEDYFVSADDMDMTTTERNSQVENALFFHKYYPTNFKGLQ